MEVVGLESALYCQGHKLVLCLFFMMRENRGRALSDRELQSAGGHKNES